MRLHNVAVSVAATSTFLWLGHSILFFGALIWTLYTILRSLSDRSVKADGFKVCIIGSGASGINMGINLKKIGVDFTIYEKSESLGGTWWLNTYPGCACDVASHLYSFSYYLNPNWSHYYSPQPEILRYMEDLASKFGIYPHIKFNKHIVKATWGSEDKMWTVETQDGEVMRANVLIQASGHLHKTVMPDIGGIDDFQGESFHSGKWKGDFRPENKSIAIIGTGASAVQILPAMAKVAKNLIVFQRTPVWNRPRDDFKYMSIFKWIFAHIPFTLRLYRWYVFLKYEFRFLAIFTRGSIFYGSINRKIRNYISTTVTDPELVKKLTPDYPLGSKRITISSEYYQAFNKDNVKLVTDKIQRITETGIQAEDKEYKVDAIVYATGFSLLKSCSEAFTTTGEDGKIMKEAWGDTPTAYLGITQPNFPNMFMLLGPNTGSTHSTELYMSECQANYTIQCIKTLIRRNKKCMSVKQEVCSDYMDWVYQKMKNKVFGAGSKSYFANSKGLNYALWVSHLSRYWWMTLTCQSNQYNYQ